MQTLQLTWKGEAYAITPSFDLFMRIEEKVAFNRIAESINQAGRGNAAEVPMSHVAWVVYCCLTHAGVRVRNPIEVHQALFDGESMPDYGSLLGGLIVAYYGSGPERVPKKKATPPPRRRKG